ncbi:MAG: M48 family metalloprotease [Alistipes sp.]|jgi:putative metalloprotease|nr:M48 family metalloprotease [Alistipes sp.]MEE0916005.1 M48 family metalloprotease [Alistipes sp.]
MKRLLIAIIAPLLLCGCGTLNTEKLISAGSNLATSFAITDAQVAQMCSEYMVYQDQQSAIAPASSKYTQRLNRLVSNIKGAEGLNLNFKVYQTDQVNAFACGDGSIRVYSGLMDAMTDEEVFAVIGHEIGHLKHADTKNMMKQAYQTAALKDAIGAINPTLERLTSSQLAAIATAYGEAQFSQKQEFAADQEAFNICIANGYSPYAMYNALCKLVELAGGSTTQSKVAQMFSTHPDSATRAARIKEMADNYNAQ